jgi:hypothetical protein
MQDLPQGAPEMPQRTGVSHDFKSSPIYGKMPITYNAGTLPKSSYGLYLDGRITQDDLTCGFQHYVKGEGKVALPKFDAYLLAVCYGAFSNGKERGEINYSSNYVLDTRTDIMQSMYFMPKDGGYEMVVLAKGNYKSRIAPALLAQNRKGFYTRVLVCYIPELDEVRAIHLSSVAEAGFLKAIAAALRVPEHKATFFNLSELSTQIWGFRFSGSFEPVVFTSKEAKNQPLTVTAERGAAKAFFQPEIQAFVFGPDTPGWESRFEKVAELRDLWFGYLSSEQSFLSQGGRLGDQNAQPSAPNQAPPSGPPAANEPPAPQQGSYTQAVAASSDPAPHVTSNAATSAGFVGLTPPPTESSDLLF